MYKYIDMSIFRPINSDESNLSIIRCVVSFSSAFTDTDIIAGGNNITKDTDLLLTPTSNNLPENFAIYYTSGVFHINYGKTFTSCTSVSIIPRLNSKNSLSSNSSSENSVLPSIFWNNLLDYGTTINAANYNFAFSFKGQDGSLITPSNSSIVNGFDLIIIGAVKLGVTTGNSNKGWSIGAGNDANSTYSFMNVGIGTGNPSSALHVQGRLDSFLNKSNIPTDISLTGSRVLTGDEILSDILNISSDGDYTLTTRTGSEIISDILSIKFHNGEVNDSFNLIMVNSSSNTITLASGSDVTILGNSVISSSETSTFKFIITGSSNVTVVKI